MHVGFLPDFMRGIRKRMKPRAIMLPACTFVTYANVPRVACAI